MKIIIILLFILSLSACSKPDPNPELKDPIYLDLQSQLSSTSQALEAENKKLEGFRKDLEAVVPQTGQIKYAQKRVFESEAVVSRLQQEVGYLKLKIEARKKEAVLSYRKSFAKKESWPNPEEFTSYQAEQKLRNAKKTWDIKERMKEAGIVPEKKGPEKSEGEHGGKEAKEEKKEH